MAGKSSRNKGKVGERELSKKLTEVFGVACRRGQQFSGIDGCDVVGLDGIHIECKRVEKLNINDAMDQSRRDAKPEEVAVVFHRKSHKEWLATCRLDDLLELLNRLSAVR